MSSTPFSQYIDSGRMCVENALFPKLQSSFLQNNINMRGTPARFDVTVYCATFHPALAEKID